MYIDTFGYISNICTLTQYGRVIHCEPTLGISNIGLANGTRAVQTRKNRIMV